MVQASKWISDARPDEPVTAVAQRAVKARLDQVWGNLPLAAQAQGEIEHVHQLRVASRRAVAALDIFRDCLARRRRKRMKRWIKRVRRAAGEARDDDVLLARLAQDGPPVVGSAVARLVSLVEAHRESVQPAIVQIEAKLSRVHFPRRAARLAKKVRWRGCGDEPSFSAAARRELGQLFGAFDEAARADLADPAALHALRIAGKELRYAMEVFAGAFAAEFRFELYPQVERLQELLGHVNDHATALARFTNWCQVPSDQDMRQAAEQLVCDAERALADSRHAFFDWWTDERAESLRRQFAAFLDGQSGSFLPATAESGCGNAAESG